MGLEEKWMGGGHIWARLLEQKTSIIIYRLATKGNKSLPFSVSICSKQTEVCRFRPLFLANNRNLPFSIISVFRIYKYIDFL
jgi:hypothetical protein